MCCIFFRGCLSLKIWDASTDVHLWVHCLAQQLTEATNFVEVLKLYPHMSWFSGTVLARGSRGSRGPDPCSDQDDPWELCKSNECSSMGARSNMLDGRLGPWSLFSLYCVYSWAGGIPDYSLCRGCTLPILECWHNWLPGLQIPRNQKMVDFVMTVPYKCSTVVAVVWK